MIWVKLLRFNGFMHPRAGNPKIKDSSATIAGAFFYTC